MTWKGRLFSLCSLLWIFCFLYGLRYRKHITPVAFCGCNNSMINTTLSPLDFIVGSNRSTPDHLPDLRRLTWPSLPFPKSKPEKGYDTYFSPRITSSEYEVMHFFISAFASAMYNIGCGDRWFALSKFAISLE